MKISEEMYIIQNCAALKLKAAQKYNISPEKCHIGHLLLQGMLERPSDIHQIDAATDEKETNISVVRRCMRLASAMTAYGLRPGDAVVIMGFNHLDLCIPFYACHFNGLAVCGMVPDSKCDGEVTQYMFVPTDIEALFPYVKPAMVFCQKDCVDKVKNAFMVNNQQGEIVIFDDKENDLQAFIHQYKGTEINYRPAEFDHAETNAWLMLTSGTTGLPKVATFPFDTILNGAFCWWQPYSYKYKRLFAMANLHWLSAYIHFVTGPLRRFTRIQSSKPLTALSLIGIINNYKPDVTAWTPFLMSQFVVAAEKGLCDLSCFHSITIGGGRVEKSVLDKFKKICSAWLNLVYGMTELLVPVFEFDDDVPVNSAGYPKDKYQYKLVDDDGNVIDKPNKSGELWIKGDDFFKGYLNNPEETKSMLTEDGWIMTGDLFYRDDQDYYVERKKLLIRCAGYWIPPLLLEEVIKRHPGVIEACVVGIPDSDLLERAVAAVQRRNGDKVDPEEIFQLLKCSVPENKQLTGGMFFVDSYPVTPSGKINRSKLREIALNTPAIMPK